MLNRLLNLLRVFASVLLKAALAFSCALTLDAGFGFMLEPPPSRRACIGIYREVDTFLDVDAVVVDSFALLLRMSLMD